MGFSMTQTVLVILTVIFAAIRVAGHKGNFYKAMAHCYVGFLFGAWFATGAASYAYLAWGLTGVEVLAFLFTKVLPRVFFLMLLCTGNIAYAQQPKPPEHMQSQRVFRVVDGDTVVLIRGGQQVTCRLIGCNAPETKHPSKPVEYYGPESSAYLKAWLEGKTVRVSYQTNPYKKDRYGRPLVYLWAAMGTQLVNLELVARGFARFDPGYPTMYRKDFIAAELAARGDRLGVWSQPDAD